MRDYSGRDHYIEWYKIHTEPIGNATMIYVPFVLVHPKPSYFITPENSLPPSDIEFTRKETQIMCIVDPKLSFDKNKEKFNVIFARFLEEHNLVDNDIDTSEYSLMIDVVINIVYENSDQITKRTKEHTLNHQKSEDLDTAALKYLAQKKYKEAIIQTLNTTLAGIIIGLLFLMIYGVWDNVINILNIFL